MTTIISPQNRSDGRMQKHKKITNPKHIEKSKLRLRIFKVLVIFCLSLTATAGGAFSFLYLFQLEDKIFKTQYDATADQLRVLTAREIGMRVAVAESFAKTYAFVCTERPYCALKIETYDVLASSLMSITNVQNIG